VAEMIAADWYGVRIEREASDRVLNLSHVLDALTDEDAMLVERMARRLADDGNVQDSEREEASPAA
jgi:hypothetical protein